MRTVPKQEQRFSNECPTTVVISYNAEAAFQQQVSYNNNGPAQRCDKHEVSAIVSSVV